HRPRPGRGGGGDGGFGRAGPGPYPALGGWCCGGRRSRPAAGLAVRRRVPATEVDSEDLTVAEKLSEFVSSRQAGWDALAGLVTSARGRVQRLDAEQVRLLGAGYRQVTADLAYARRRFGADPVT